MATWLTVAAAVFLLPLDKTRLVVILTVAVLMSWLAVAIGGISALDRFRLWPRTPI